MATPAQISTVRVLSGLGFEQLPPEGGVVGGPAVFKPTKEQLSALEGKKLSVYAAGNVSAE